MSASHDPLAAVRATLRKEEDIAKLAYERITEDGPVEVPTWDRLNHVERRHLILFARQVMWIAEGESGQ